MTGTVEMFVTSYKRAVRESRQILVLVIATPLAIPIFMLVVFPRVFQAVATLPQFEGGDSYLQYIAPATILMSVMLGSLTGAVSVAFERRTGFYDRLLIGPAGPAISNFARRLSDAVRLVVFGILMTVLARLNGAEIENWALVLAVTSFFVFSWSLAYGGLPFAMCLGSGKAEAAQMVLPLFFPVLFMSDAFLPRELLPGWLEAIATYNPATYITGVMRDAYQGAFDSEMFAKALLGTVVVLILTQLLVRRAERKAVG